MRIENLSKRTVVAEEALVAASVVSRTLGLMGRGPLAESEALILRPCRSIHTWFMRYPIDIIFTDKSKRVVKTVESIRPFWFVLYVPGAWAAVEMATGSIARSKTAAGDQLSF